MWLRSRVRSMDVDIYFTGGQTSATVAVNLRIVVHLLSNNADTITKTTFILPC